MPNIASRISPVLSIKCWGQDNNAITPPQEQGVYGLKNTIPET